MPFYCLKSKPVMTPKGKYTHDKVVWASPIINGLPKKISFKIIENPFYILIFFLFVFLGVFLTIYLIIRRKDHITIIMTYFGIFVGLRLAFKIPSYITLNMLLN